MVLQAVYTVVSAIFPSRYYLHISLSAIALVVVYAFVQGRTTNRERDLHARVIIVTGAFTPLGLTLLAALAARGAHVIAISDYPLEHPYPSLIIPVLRSTSNNENIFAEYADLTNPASIREFCTRFLTGQDQRLDAIVFGHEYRAIGSFIGRSHKVATFAEKRETLSLATFLMITLLLPALLVEPAERDIRIVNVVNPFYAASAPAFTSQLTASSSLPAGSHLLHEGFRALRTTILTRHLQRVLDSLPNNASDVPKSPAGGSASGSASSAKQPSKKPDTPHPSNITAVSVCPGISRKDIIAPLLGAERDSEGGYSLLGFVIYTLLFPLLVLLTKSPISALQSVLHVLFLPTPLKRALAHVDASINPTAASTAPDDSAAGKPVRPNIVVEEVLKPGALYRECAVVPMTVPPLAPSVAPQEPDKDSSRQGKEEKKAEEPGMSLPDDGEYGGEAVGRVVWEWYEEQLKAWEARSKETRSTQEQETQPQASSTETKQ